MPNLTHQITRSYKDISGTAVSQTENPTGNSEVNFDESVANGSTDLHFANQNIKRANLKALLIYSDKVVTIKTNSSGSPTDTIVTVAGQVRVWTLATDLLAACPISADVTDFYITNSSGSAARVKVVGLILN